MIHLKKKFDALADSVYDVDDFIQTQLKTPNLGNHKIFIFFRRESLCFIGTFTNNECTESHAVLEIGKELIYFATDDVENKIICKNYFQTYKIPQDVLRMYHQSKNTIKKIHIIKII